MESNHNINHNKNTLKNPEIQGYKEKIKMAIDEIEILISEDIDDLKSWMSFVRLDFQRLERIKEENNWISEHQELANECGFVPENENVDSIKEDILRTQEMINTIKTRVVKLQSYSEHFKAQLKLLNELEKQFVTLVTKINPNQLR